jgi:hypothetical protein
VYPAAALELDLRLLGREGEIMDQQNSQKTGVRSDAQKQDRARDGHSAIPPAKPVGGAFGKEQDDRDEVDRSDEDASLRHNT